MRVSRDCGLAKYLSGKNAGFVTPVSNGELDSRQPLVVKLSEQSAVGAYNAVKGDLVAGTKGLVNWGGGGVSEFWEWIIRATSAGDIPSNPMRDIPSKSLFDTPFNAP